jgi:hypothetical protein
VKKYVANNISIRTESYAFGFDEPLLTQAIATVKPVPIEAWSGLTH